MSFCDDLRASRDAACAIDPQSPSCQILTSTYEVQCGGGSSLTDRKILPLQDSFITLARAAIHMMDEDGQGEDD